MPRFQDELRESLRSEGTIYKAIEETKDLSDETTAKLEEELEKFKKALQRRGRQGHRGVAMACVQDLKRRVRSVKNTRKITKAMELVASARLRRAQTRIEAMRPYAETMRELIAGVGRASASVRGLPLLQQRDEVTNVAIVPLTGDRGLAGPFNAQILRRAFALERQLRAEGANGQLPGRRQEGPLDARVPPLRGRRRVRRLHRPARRTRTRRRSRTASPSSSPRARSTA